MNIHELEAQFKQIDRLSNEQSVEANITDQTNLVVNATAASGGFGLADAEPETVLNVNLNNVDVPADYVDAAVTKIFSNPEPGGELPGIKVMQIPSDLKNYQVLEDYSYHADAGYDITVTKNFVYDRASIPRIFWAIIDKDDLSNVAPVFHDLLYRNGGVLPESQVSPYRTFVRDDVDRLFLELAGKCGVKSWRAKLAYQAVHNFGGSSWQPHH